jgi:hypothetical protein
MIHLEGAAPSAPVISSPRRRSPGADGAAPSRVLHSCAALVMLVAFGARGASAGPFADAVVSFTPGPNGGFGADKLPEIVLGAPQGGGLLQQSLDVVSLGDGGTITLRMDAPLICDAPGPDLTIFENAFHSGTVDGPIFAEYGIVAVSQDGEHFVEFPYDAMTHRGLAGREPVLSNSANAIDPLDPSVSGGDHFDLAEVGLAWAAYVRITDPGAAIPDPGNLVPGGNKGGFDLDAIAALHACDPSALPSATRTPSAEQTATPTPSPTPSEAVVLTATATPSAAPGDIDGDGRTDTTDLRLLIAEIYDGDGDDAGNTGGGRIATTAAVDVNGDGHITAADITALVRRWMP